MKFVRVEDLKIGMRLARPIYNKKGVLLFERNTGLSAAGIQSVKNFGLLGIYILEPAEPLPPMSEEDLEFERFQTVMVAAIEDEIEKMYKAKHKHNFNLLVNQILRKYGHVDGKINFYQNLRSRADYVSRHSLNVAILCALMVNQLNVPLSEREVIVQAALVHDVGKIGTKNEAAYGAQVSNAQKSALAVEAIAGCDILEEAFAADGPTLKRYCTQVIQVQDEVENDTLNPKRKLVNGAKILLVANHYDEMTAMSLSGESRTEVKAIQEFAKRPDVYDPEIVAALVKSINILFPGVSVELSTGEKALVLTENKRDVLRPSVLSFRDNTVLDLSLYENRDISVVDVMKTLDNRYIMDMDALVKNAGMS